MTASSTLLRIALAALLPIAAAPAAHAGAVLDRITASSNLRVCIWPDYYGVTYRNPRTQQLGGIDVELSQEFGKDLAKAVVHVDSSFPKLIEDLLADRCDVAMFAIGVLPAREQALKFSQPYLQSDIYGVTTRSSRVVKSWADIDQPGVQVAVQAGTFMEPVMAAALKQAKMVVIRPPQTREQELEAGRVDVFMTDYPYSRRVVDNAEWARVMPPEKSIFPLSYAYAVAPGDDAWLARVEQFVSDIKRDGRLLAAARASKLEAIVLTQ